MFAFPHTTDVQPARPRRLLRLLFYFSVAQLNATSQLLYVRQREYVLLGAFWTMVQCLYRRVWVHCQYYRRVRCMGAWEHGCSANIGAYGCTGAPESISSISSQAVIQFTAFLMTLRKKGLLPPDAWKWAYFAMLASVRDGKV